MQKGGAKRPRNIQRPSEIAEGRQVKKGIGVIALGEGEKADGGLRGGTGDPAPAIQKKLRGSLKKKREAASRATASKEHLTTEVGSSCAAHRGGRGEADAELTKLISTIGKKDMYRRLLKQASGRGSADQKPRT